MTVTDEQQIDDYVARLKSDGGSAPAGRRWDDLYRGITQGLTDTRPSLSLILADSMASNADKQLRLREHPLWASARGRLAEAFDLLEQVPEDGWSTGGPKDRIKSFSCEDDQ